MNNYTSAHTYCEHELLYNHETIGTWKINGNLLDFMCPPTASLQRQSTWLQRGLCLCAGTLLFLPCPSNCCVLSTGDRDRKTRFPLSMLTMKEQRVLTINQTATTLSVHHLQGVPHPSPGKGSMPSRGSFDPFS